MGNKTLKRETPRLSRAPRKKKKIKKIKGWVIQPLDKQSHEFTVNKERALNWEDEYFFKVRKAVLHIEM